MRKSLIAVALLLCGVTSSMAQELSNFKFGAKAGLNLSSLSLKEGSGMRPSFYLGAIAEFGLGSKFAIAPELLFSMQGNKHSEDGWSSTLSTNYLNIPIMVKYYILDKLSVSAGPQIGFCLGGKYKYKYEGKSDSDLLEHYNTLDFGLNLGVEYTIIHNLGVELRYNLGLTNLEKSQTYEGKTKKYDSKNRVIQIGVKYTF